MLLPVCLHIQSGLAVSRRKWIWWGLHQQTLRLQLTESQAQKRAGTGVGHSRDQVSPGTAGEPRCDTLHPTAAASAALALLWRVPTSAESLPDCKYSLTRDMSLDCSPADRAGEEAPAGFARSSGMDTNATREDSSQWEQYWVWGAPKRQMATYCVINT